MFWSWKGLHKAVELHLIDYFMAGFQFRDSRFELAFGEVKNGRRLAIGGVGGTEISNLESRINKNQHVK